MADLLVLVGFASIYSTGSDTTSISFDDSFLPPFCLSRYSLSYFSKSLSFSFEVLDCVSSPTKDEVIFSGLIINEPHFSQKLFLSEFSDPHSKQIFLLVTSNSDFSSFTLVVDFSRFFSNANSGLVDFSVLGILVCSFLTGSIFFILIRCLGVRYCWTRASTYFLSWIGTRLRVSNVSIICFNLSTFPLPISNKRSASSIVKSDI